MDSRWRQANQTCVFEYALFVAKGELLEFCDFWQGGDGVLRVTPVSFTNKTDRHDTCFNWNIVENGRAKHQSW